MDDAADNQLHEVVGAACAALISLERVLAAWPDPDRRPDLRRDLGRARDSLREAIRELRLAGNARPGIHELDFVTAELRPAASESAQSKPLRTA